MELIEALEQLSLEVRNQRLTNSNCNHISNIINVNVNEQPKTTSRNNSSNQLDDFDNSIATLFSQITDLDLSQNLKSVEAVASRRAKYITYSPHNRALNFFETSQEDDSDSSSLRSSGYATTTSNSSSGSSTLNHDNGGSNDQKQQQPMNPLVRDLLKRDLNTITGTVRKIGQILTVGSEIESIYKNLFARLAPQMSAPQNTSHHHHQYQFQGIDLNGARSLCETFMELFTSEQHIGDLPTMIHYNNYCHRLLNLLQTINDSTNYEQPKAIDALEAEDVEFLNENEALSDGAAQASAEMPTIWTENKLYIDQRPNN